MTSRSADALTPAVRDNEQNPPGNSQIQQDEPRNEASNTSNIEEHIQEENRELDPPPNIDITIPTRAENNTRRRQK